MFIMINFCKNSNNDYHYPFSLVPLPYAYSALEPFIDEKTMQLHHDRHLATYVNNLNATLKDYPALHNCSLEELLFHADLLPPAIATAVINNGGGVYNHNMYFAGFKPANLTNKPNLPMGTLLQAINAQFGSFDNFKKEFKEKALAVFGSGYTWLASDKNGKLSIVNTKNQDTILPMGLTPILLIDIWEHAYYLKHYNMRADYIDDYFNVINFDIAQQNYNKVAGKQFLDTVG